MSRKIVNCTGTVILLAATATATLWTVLTGALWPWIPVAATAAAATVIRRVIRGEEA